uniref:NB-ARC domain-containing protein n=1 Tax=Oryza barthii TaxID=65489 RepID=A0A0D3GH28_9ORYZ
MDYFIKHEAVELAKSLLGLEGSALKRLFSEIRDVKGELESIRALLQAAERFKDADETTSAFVKQIRRLAFGIEDAVDEFTYQLGEGGGRMPFKRMCKIGTWSRLAANLQDIKVSLKSAAERRIRYDLKGVVVRGVKSVVGSSSNSNWRSDSVHFKRDDDLVGVDKNRDLLMRWVQDQQQRHRIVSVWGMGGIGKTALVANVYNAVKDDFDTCAWITVSQSYDADDLLRTTVQEFRKNDRKKDFPDDEGASSYRRLVETIRSYLENKRYVLVLDDVWSTNVWFDSKDAFGGANIIGRIILTSRNYDVALLAPETNIINLQPLVKSHAWDLFCKEAFWKNGNRDCPPELFQLAQNFVDKCHGLPIVIICIGRLLSFQGSTHSDWEKVHKNLEMQLTNNSVMDMMNIILKISLADLPHNIKNRFLYCSMFPEAFVMKTKSLVRLWVAEGFIDETEQKSPEETAEDYLTELVNRCLLLGKIVKLPLEITKLHKLTHLIVTSKPVVGSLQFVPSIGVPAPVGICSLTSLRTLLMMEASFELVHHLGALVQLRTFRISKVQSCHCEHLFLAITNMIHLTRLGIQADSSQEVLNLEALRPPPLLQKLYLKGTLSKESLPHFMSLSNLNNLGSLRLVGSRLDRDTFLNLERLPHLVKLQLYDAYDGKNIYFHENSFPKLRELSIRGAPHLNEIEMKRGAVASLTDLKLLVCPNLKQLPYGI